MISTLGRYKIVSEIGQGAMGVVYKAVDPIIDRTVAIKTINLNLSRQELEEYEQRFQQEIKAAGRLNHPNIVTIYDVGKTEQVAYMAMEFLEGLELKDMIASGNVPAADQVKAMKTMAFTLCLRDRFRDCRNEFIKIYDVDPNFDLTPAEAGHPSWTKTFAAAKAQAHKNMAAREKKEKGGAGTPKK